MGVKASGRVGTAPYKQIHSLTSLRWVCALFVYLFHVEFRRQVFSGPVHDLVLNGYTGMTFFFVLSGFVLIVRYFGSATPYRDYLVARVARIYPAFLVAFAAALPALLLGPPAGLSLLAVDLAANATLTQAWFPNLWNLGINGGTWSLSVEMFCYALFPVGALLLGEWLDRRRRVVVALSILWLASFLPGLIQRIEPADGGMLFFYSSPAYRLPEFLLGMTVAIAWRRGLLPVTSIWLVMVALLAAVVSFLIYNGWLDQNLTLLNFTAVPFVTIAILFAAQARPRWLATRWLVHLGEVSYGFYLFQFVFLIYVLPRLGSVPAWVAMLMGLVMTLVIASLSFHFIERPARVWIRQAFARPAEPRVGESEVA